MTAEDDIIILKGQEFNTFIYMKKIKGTKYNIQSNLNKNSKKRKITNVFTDNVTQVLSCRFY